VKLSKESVVRRPWTVFVAAHLLALGLAWVAAEFVNSVDGAHMSAQGSYLRLVPLKP
jgi:hypothetical protein